MLLFTNDDRKNDKKYIVVFKCERILTQICPRYFWDVSVKKIPSTYLKNSINNHTDRQPQLQKNTYHHVNVDDEILIQTRHLDVPSAVSRNINIHNEVI